MRRKLSAKGVSCSRLRYRRSLGRIPVTNSRSSDVADMITLARIVASFGRSFAMVVEQFFVELFDFLSFRRRFFVVP